MSNVYVQVQNNGDWMTSDCHIAAYTFSRMGRGIIRFKLSDINTRQFDGINLKEDVVHGGIRATNNILKRFDISRDRIPNPNESEFKKYTGREFKVRTQEKSLMILTMQYIHLYSSNH